MERVTLRMPKPMLEAVEREVERGLYPNRSEALRSMVRDGLERPPQTHRLAADEPISGNGRPWGERGQS